MLTPQDYYHGLKNVLKHTPDAIIKDLFVVPDYDKYFDGCADTKFGSYCKKEYSQLQFTFEAVDISDDFPLGCRITYRAYSKDTVIEICQVETPTMPGINLKPQECHVRTYPEEQSERGIPEGMYILQRLPPQDRILHVVPLLQGSRALLDEVLTDIKKTYNQFQPQVVEAWRAWDDTLAPASDDVDQYQEK